MFGLLNAPSPKRASSLGARPRSAPGLGKLDTFAALTVPTMCPLVCRAASGLVYPREAQSEAAKKGAKQAIPPALCLAPPVAAALLWRRLAHKLHRTQTNWRSLQWALIGIGPAAAERRSAAAAGERGSMSRRFSTSTKRGRA